MDGIINLSKVSDEDFEKIYAKIMKIINVEGCYPPLSEKIKICKIFKEIRVMLITAKELEEIDAVLEPYNRYYGGLKEES